MKGHFLTGTRSSVVLICAAMRLLQSVALSSDKMQKDAWQPHKGAGRSLEPCRLCSLPKELRLKQGPTVSCGSEGRVSVAQGFIGPLGESFTLEASSCHP